MTGAARAAFALGALMGLVAGFILGVGITFGLLLG